MESSSTGKRKKRKTRKCLDEIRKRSRFNINVSDTISNEDAHKNKDCEYNAATYKRNNAQTHKEFNSKITSKRLTLKPTFLSKTIISETITRPMLSHNILAKTSTHDKFKWDQNLMHDSASNIVNIVPSASAGGKESSIPGFVIEDNSHPPQKSFSLFTPENGVVDMLPDGNMESKHSSAPTALSVSSCSSSGDSVYHLYAEFVKEIPIYLQNNAASLVKKNTMEKTKIMLQKIFLEDCHQESDEIIPESISNRIRNSRNSIKYVNMWSDSIVDNPMTYMRMSRSEVDGTRRSPAPTAPPRSPAAASTASPLASSPELSFIRHTPDYNYYPRKLNQ